MDKNELAELVFDLPFDDLNAYQKDKLKEIEKYFENKNTQN